MLNEMTKNINSIKENYDEFKKDIYDFFDNNIKSFDLLLDNIKTFIDWSGKNNYFNHKLFDEDIKPFLIFHKKLLNVIYESKLIKKINQLNKNFEEISKLKVIPAKIEKKNNSNIIIDFNVSELNKSNASESSSTNDIENPFSYEQQIAKEKELAEDFSYIKNEGNLSNDSIIISNNIPKNTIIINVQEEKKEDEKRNEEKKEDEKKEDEKRNDEKRNDDTNKDNNNDSIIKCIGCNTYKATKVCSHCFQCYCSGCCSFKEKYENGHIFFNILDYAKNNILNSLIEIIKYYLLKVNYLLNSEQSVSTIANIKDINDFESQKNFLNEINKLCSDNIDYSNYKTINEQLIEKLKNIFNDKILDISQEIYNSNCSFFEKNDLNVEEYNRIKNKFFYFITVIPKGKLENISNLDKIIIQNITSKLFIDKTNIFLLINDKINNFVKCQNFYELHYSYFQTNNPICKKLKELKMLCDEYLCEKWKINKNNFDYRGNTVNPNSSNNLIRGTEQYDPPYGWIGIGLNVLGKYDNDDKWLNDNTKLSDWAIAYHAVNPKNKSYLVKLLKYIIINRNLDIAITQIGSKSNDKRNWGKVDKGIYLTPKIGIAEKFAGIIPFKNKKYKVLFMARVYIKKIREPENSYFWVLDNKNIRIYRILFK